MHNTRLRFVQSFGSFAKIEGSVMCGADALEFELAMTECVSGPVKGILKRSIPYVDFDDVIFRRRFLIRPQLTFTTRNLISFESLPGAKGYEYAITPKAERKTIQSFVVDVRLAIAQAASERFEKQIEDSIS